MKTKTIMKKLFILTLLILLPTFILKGQTTSIDAVYVTYQLADHGIGLRLDYHVMNLQLYGSGSYGWLGLYREANLENHSKFTLGGKIPLKDNWNKSKCHITTGINYHIVKGEGMNNGNFDTSRILKPWSFELGTTVYFGRFAMGVRTDILRWEPCIDIGININ